MRSSVTIHVSLLSINVVCIHVLHSHDEGKMISRPYSNWNDILQGRKLAWLIVPYINQLDIHDKDYHLIEYRYAIP